MKLTTIFGTGLAVALTGFAMDAAALKIETTKQEIGGKTYVFGKLTQCEPLEGNDIQGTLCTSWYSKYMPPTPNNALGHLVECVDLVASNSKNEMVAEETYCKKATHVRDGEYDRYTKNHLSLKESAQADFFGTFGPLKGDLSPFKP